MTQFKSITLCRISNQSYFIENNLSVGVARPSKSETSHCQMSLETLIHHHQHHYQYQHRHHHHRHPHHHHAAKKFRLEKVDVYQNSNFPPIKRNSVKKYVPRIWIEKYFHHKEDFSWAIRPWPAIWLNSWNYETSPNQCNDIHLHVVLEDHTPFNYFGIVWSMGWVGWGAIE